MAAHLLLGAMTPNWKLHVSEDPAEVRHRLNEAHRSGIAADVKVVVADQLAESTVTVNTQALGWWSVVDLPDADSAQIF